jgi:Zn-dependent peptidase ImmA (M78 family)
MKDEYNECKTRLMNLPPSVRGFCYHDDEGNEFIFLNARLTREANRASYGHEIRHIENGDGYNPNYREYNK